MDWSSILGYSVNEVQTREELSEGVYGFMIRVSINVCFGAP